MHPKTEILRTTPGSLTLTLHTTKVDETLIDRIVHSRSQDGEERYGQRSQRSRDCALTITTAKSRTVAVRLMSMAMTGFFMTFRRPRTHRPLSMLKYDPVGKCYRRSCVYGILYEL
jgi:large subunit ribosomal protein L33